MLKPKDDDDYFTKDEHDNIKINKEVIKIKCNGIIGNYFYTSPEMLDYGIYDEKSDI